MKLWSGRFKKNTLQLADEYNASIGFDHILAEFDIQGSLAHVKMLGYCNILEKKSVDSITEGLHTLSEKLKNNEMEFSIADEDIHMNIERLLHQLIGDEAHKLHTGRSRNDQVALDLHLYLRHQILTFIQKLCEINQVFVKLAEDNIDVIMPGYTHLQRAEPVRFSHHVLAYFNMFYRDTERLISSFERVNICPLGAGALAGSGIAVDRQYVAKLLNFQSIYENSLDAVSDRDFIAEFLFNSSLIMMHFSKLSEEIILWSSQEFSFIQLDDQFCTGSSMMPQKKNPDIAELARGKVGRVYGALIGILTLLKGLPLAYNKDLQEDKEGLFDTVKTVSKTLSIYAPMLSSMQINKAVMHNAVNNDYSNATQLANYLVKQGIAFREAHEITGKIILHCIDYHILLKEMSLESFKTFCSQIDNTVYDFITIENVVEAHAAEGGTSKNSVLTQIMKSHEKINSAITWLTEKNKILEVD
jgi:argininosuccinate lyase